MDADLKGFIDLGALGRLFLNPEPRLLKVSEVFRTNLFKNDVRCS